ncbi:hypothetical protein [Lacinutrix mariniflava]|uniref:hypothetical protein n=1 Tax=Lacinutrix mariniflava TaxID=342955 RepID=UPI0006E22336|nr:hypothetical protein [Lacinutrix mariniflava]
MKAKSIKFNHAITYAKKWQGENETHAKGFLIPSNDLIACLEEMNILVNDGSGKYTLNDDTNSGVRAYMAIKRPDGTPATAQTEKLLLVGTIQDCNGIHRDIVHDEKSSGCTDRKVEIAVANLNGGSGIFDFTAPCPDNCDPNSPLVNP